MVEVVREQHVLEEAVALGRHNRVGEKHAGHHFDVVHAVGGEGVPLFGLARLVGGHFVAEHGNVEKVCGRVGGVEPCARLLGAQIVLEDGVPHVDGVGARVRFSWKVVVFEERIQLVPLGRGIADAQKRVKGLGAVRRVAAVGVRLVAKADVVRLQQRKVKLDAVEGGNGFGVVKEEKSGSKCRMAGSGSSAHHV